MWFHPKKVFTSKEMISVRGLYKQTHSKHSKLQVVTVTSVIGFAE